MVSAHPLGTLEWLQILVGAGNETLYWYFGAYHTSLLGAFLWIVGCQAQPWLLRNESQHILTPEVMTQPSPVMVQRAEVRFESHHPRFVKVRMIWRELGTWRFQIVAKGEQEIIREKETEHQSPGCICHWNLIIKQSWMMLPRSAGPQEEKDTGFIWN